MAVLAALGLVVVEAARCSEVFYFAVVGLPVVVAEHKLGLARAF